MDQSERSRAYYERNREAVLEKQALRRHVTHRQHILEYHRQYHSKTRHAGATRPKPALCECCGGEPGKRGLQYDHDHETGKFRGWICFWCNTGIGKLGDSIEGLKKAVAYLERG